MKKAVKHLLQLSMAWIFIMLGVIFLFSPIPIGIIFMAIGLSLLIYASDSVRHKVQQVRGRHHRFNTQLIWAEEKLANRVNFVSHAMRDTRPTISSPTIASATITKN
ncbi:hypothetical protein NBRC116494_29050 [Aurantivibrio plasticivorans]